MTTNGLVPDTLDAWTLDAVRALLEQGAFETDRFDFKLALPQSGDGRDRLRGVAASFANTAGGFIVLGVDDDRTRSVDQRLIGITAAAEVPEHFGALLQAIEPSVQWQYKNPPLRLESGAVIHVIHVPRSRSAPHGLERDGRWRFPKRTNQGTGSMSLTEMRSAFVDQGARVAAVRLIDHEITRVANLAERHNRDSQRARTALPETLYLELYRTSALDSKLSFVFEEVADTYAARAFQEVLTAAGASDLLATTTAARQSAAPLEQHEVHAAASMLGSYARRVMNSAHGFRASFDQVRDAIRGTSTV